MRYIKDLTEGARVGDIYLIKSKSSAVTKNGKNYLNLTLSEDVMNLVLALVLPNPTTTTSTPLTSTTALRRRTSMR